MKLKYSISTIIIYTTIILYSCEIKQIDTNTITNKTDSIKHEPFKGIGELIVDTPFEKVSNYKKFKKNGNIYSLEKYEISKEIGVVEFVEVEVYKGLIYKVNFCNGPFTNKFYFKINDTTISSGYNNVTYIDYVYNDGSVTIEEVAVDANGVDANGDSYSNEGLINLVKSLHGDKATKFHETVGDYNTPKVTIGHPNFRNDILTFEEKFISYGELLHCNYQV